MPIPDEFDQEKVAEAALAVLSLSAFDSDYDMRVWKGVDWDVMDLLHERGWISNPKGKAKSVHITKEGLERANAAAKALFAKASQ
jgi:hypothetical protein